MGKVTLFCLPNAGGSAVMYLKWKKYLSPYIELYPIEIAGRGKRVDEPLFTNVDEIVSDIYGLIKNHIDKQPYAIFGYSMGSLVGFELCQKLKRNGHKEPVHFFTASLEAPQFVAKKKNIYNLPMEEFKREVLNFNGIPQEIANDISLLNYFLSILKSDFKAMDTYEYSDESILMKTNLTILYGEEDNFSLDNVYGWKNLTTGESVVHKFSGGHFFINNNLNEIIEKVNQTIERVELGNVHN
ncbi:medium-chain acyl-[acyl-carrier-protein] hydrolase [Bacillus sp. RC242]|uniref:thioesterase II family protein n=1 Tax=Bacillus sp. RC242 TaxID=3156286 RepID=UPI003836F17C